MNTTIVARPTSSRSNGLRLKFAVVVPDMIISSLIWLVLIAALPPAVAFGVTAAAVAVATVLAAGLGENTAVRILYGARRPTPTEARLLAGPCQMVACRVEIDGLRLRIVPKGAPVSTAGRRHVLLARDVVDAYRADRITDGEVAALIAHGIGLLRHGYTRLDLLWVFWTAPWDFIRGLVVSSGRHLAWVPLGGFAWQTRFIVGGIAVVLETQAGRWPAPIVIGVFIALSYVMPRWGSSWEEHLAQSSDEFAAELGFREGNERLAPPTPFLPANVVQPSPAHPSAQ